MYPRAADQVPAPAIDVAAQPRWLASLADWFGLVGAVWALGLGMLLVGIPIALAAALAIWIGRLAHASF